MGTSPSHSWHSPAQPWVGVSGISPSSCTKVFLLTSKLIPTAQPLISPWEPGVMNKGRSQMLSAPACCWVNNTSWAGCLYGAEHTRDESLFPPWGQAGVAALPKEGFPGFKLRGEGPCWLGNVLVGFPAPGMFHPQHLGYPVLLPQCCISSWGLGQFLATSSKVFA